MTAKGRNWREECALAFKHLRLVVPFDGKIRSNVHAVQLAGSYLTYLEQLCSILDMIACEDSLPRIKLNFYETIKREGDHSITGVIPGKTEVLRDSSTDVASPQDDLENLPPLDLSFVENYNDLEINFD